MWYFTIFLQKLN